MKEDEKSRQLKMALTEHKNLMLNTENNISFLLAWDEHCSNYRAYALPEEMNVGTFGLELLLQIIDGEVDGAKLEFYGG